MIPPILEPVEDPDYSGDGSSKEHGKNWARLIQKINEVDPLNFIEGEEIIMKILQYSGFMANNGQTTTQSHRGNKKPGILHRRLILPAPSACPPCVWRV